MKNIHASGGGEAGRRRREILALVGGGGVRSQEDLQRRLRRRGIAVAQPTLSRDLKTLGLAKTPTGYVPTPAGAFVPAETRTAALDRAVDEFVLSVRAAASLVVVRTIRPKFVRRDRERGGETRVHIAELPELPIERGLAGPGMLADTIPT